MSKWSISLAAGAAILIFYAVLAVLLDGPDQVVDARQAGPALQSGIDLFNQKRYDEAIESLRQVPRGSKHESTAKYYEGSAQLMLKNDDAAVATLQEALLLAPDDPQILYALGVASFKLGNVKLAKGYFASVLDIAPRDERDEELHKQARGLMDKMAILERRDDGGQSVVPPAHGARESTSPDAEDETVPSD